MKTLIFEGIATSGKSKITGYLTKSLRDQVLIKLASEEQTHIPIMLQKAELHTLFFEGLINELILTHPDLLIFDRLYITQAYRAGADLSQYHTVEDTLKPYSPHTIVLKVAEDAIAARIEAAAKHRESKWSAYLQTKGGTYAEIAEYYIAQQQGILKLVQQSTLPYTIFDTTTHDYDTITEEIIRMVQK